MQLLVGADQGRTVVPVTPNLPFSIGVAGRLVVLRRGTKVADVVTDEADDHHLVGRITGARGSQFA